MTNEELAARVKGQDPGATLELWEAVRRFVSVQAQKYARACEGRASADDLIQSGFIAMLDAAGKFEKDRGAGFLTVLNYELKNRFREEVGIRTSKRDAMQYSRSIDEPAFSDEEGTPVISQIEDSGAALAFTGIEYSDFIRYARLIIDSALGMLPEKQAAILKLHYLENIPLDQAAPAAGIASKQAASCTAERALCRLANGKYSRELRACLDAFDDFQEYHSAAQVGNYTRYRQTGISSTEAAAMVK